MKAYYVLSIVAAAVVSTVVGTDLVVAGTQASPQVEVASAQSASLELLTAESAATTTWRRPL